MDYIQISYYIKDKRFSVDIEKRESDEITDTKIIQRFAFKTLEEANAKFQELLTLNQ